MTDRQFTQVPEPYLDRREIAEVLGVHVNTVDRMVAAGMPSETWGRRVRRFRASEVIEWARTQDRGSVAA